MLSRRGFISLAAASAAGLLAACGAPAPPPSPAETSSARSAERARKPADLWNGSGLDARVLFQRELDQLPEGPFMLRVTELEMEPGARIDPHAHLGPGVQVVLAGAFTVKEAAAQTPVEYGATPARPYPVYYTGQTIWYSTENRGPTWNRLFMAELMSRSRGFLGNQQFETEGTVHNSGGVRSGPYLQAPFELLAEPPLMVRVSQIDMGPKGKTPEYTRPGPGVFFVVSGQGTFRYQDALSIHTQGAGGYFFDPAVEPMILENKPITPNRLIAVEFLPASLGKQPSTVPTGRDI
jgi:quercetin dioxygenase-like cupin family protein